jgi:hypothetical protein
VLSAENRNDFQEKKKSVSCDDVDTDGSVDCRGLGSRDGGDSGNGSIEIGNPEQNTHDLVVVSSVEQVRQRQRHGRALV